MYPENTATLPDGEALTSYSFSMANTFVNTQGSTQKITKTEYDRGIVASDFNSADTGQAVPNLGLYMVSLCDVDECDVVANFKQISSISNY